jgi:alkanesulfonate monooxygenase SsuD/methylene tetrahydromethanopterin reductase-like flavin-dependent oxidoreductase (luciferase family)
MQVLLDELRRLTEAERRDFSTLTISYKAPLYDVGQGVDGGSERRPFSGSPQAIADDIGTFARLGVSELVFDFRSDTLSESLDRMERFAALVRS